MNLVRAYGSAESGYHVAPAVPGAAMPYRSLLRRSTVDFTAPAPAATAALYRLFTPNAGSPSSLSITYADFDTALTIDGAAALDDDGDPAAFGTVQLIHIRVFPYGLTAVPSGTVVAEMSDLLASGTTTSQVMGPGAQGEGGDEYFQTCRAGYATNSGSTLALTVTDPVNLAIEVILIGRLPA
jgi:hypothetical protein